MRTLALGAAYMFERATESFAIGLVQLLYLSHSRSPTHLLGYWFISFTLMFGSFYLFTTAFLTLIWKGRRDYRFSLLTSGLLVLHLSPFLRGWWPDYRSMAITVSLVGFGTACCVTLLTSHLLNSSRKLGQQS